MAVVKDVKDGHWPTTRPSLLGRMKAGDQEAWADFVQIYTPLICRYCRFGRLQDADALDVTAEVLLIASRSLRNYDPARGRFRGWLGAVTRNEIKRFLQTMQRPGAGRGGGGLDATLENIASGPEDLDWTRIFNSRILEVALERIRPEFDEITWRAFQAVAVSQRATEDGKEFVWVEDRSAPQVAERVAQELQKTVAWVYKAKFRVLNRLRQEVLFLAEDMGLLGQT